MLDSLSPDRRRYERLKILTSVAPGAPTVEFPFTLRDISLGGFCIDSPHEFQTGHRRTFSFTVDQQPPVSLTGVVRHSMRVTMPDGARFYVTGFEFEEASPDHAMMLQQLLDHAAVLASP